MLRYIKNFHTFQGHVKAELLSCMDQTQQTGTNRSPQKCWTDCIFQSWKAAMSNRVQPLATSKENFIHEFDKVCMAQCIIAVSQTVYFSTVDIEPRWPTKSCKCTLSFLLSLMFLVVVILLIMKAAPTADHGVATSTRMDCCIVVSSWTVEFFEGDSFCLASLAERNEKDFCIYEQISYMTLEPSASSMGPDMMHNMSSSPNPVVLVRLLMSDIWSMISIMRKQRALAKAWEGRKMIILLKRCLTSCQLLLGLPDSNLYSSKAEASLSARSPPLIFIASFSPQNLVWRTHFHVPSLCWRFENKQSFHTCSKLLAAWFREQAKLSYLFLNKQSILPESTRTLISLNHKTNRKKVSLVILQFCLGNKYVQTNTLLIKALSIYPFLNKHVEQYKHL